LGQRRTVKINSINFFLQTEGAAMSQRQHTKQREGSREVPEMMVGKQNAKPGSSVIGIEIKREFPHPLLSTPLARPLWEVTRGCRQCSQGTIGGSRLQGLGGHNAGEDRSWITGAKPPAPDFITAPLRSEAACEKGGRWDGMAGRGRHKRKSNGGSGRRGLRGCAAPAGLRVTKTIRTKTRQ